MTIKRCTASTSAKDNLVKTHPCDITIRGRHNHAVRGAAALKELRVLPEVADHFDLYFEQGMGASQAARLHSMKRAAEGELVEMARNDKNPSKRAVTHLHEKWQKKEHGGYGDEDMAEALKRYAVSHPETTVKAEKHEGHMIIAVVTPLHKRVHQEVREAGEVVFVDGTASVDRLNTLVLPFLCATPAGALPLGFVLTSSQDESSLTAGELH